MEKTTHLILLKKKKKKTKSQRTSRLKKDQRIKVRSARGSVSGTMSVMVMEPDDDAALQMHRHVGNNG